MSASATRSCTRGSPSAWRQGGQGLGRLHRERDGERHGVVDVAGAAVSAAGRSVTTGSDGVAKLKFRAAKAGRTTITVKKGGCATASAIVAVKRWDWPRDGGPQARRPAAR